MGTITTRKKRLGVGELQQLKQKTRSGLEAKSLALLEQYKVPYEYEPKDKKIAYVVPEKPRTYLPDIIINGNIYELKGMLDMDSQLKMKLIRQQHPELDITLVFQRNNKIRKNSKTTYGMWAEKNGLKWMLIGEFEELIRNNKL